MSRFDAEIARLAARQHRVVTSRQVLEAGGSHRMIHVRLADERWTPVMRGAYLVDPGPVPWRARVHAACLTLDGFASEETAGVLHRLPNCRPDEIHITVLGDRHVGRGGIIVHRVPELHAVDRAVAESIPVTSVALTIVGLGRTMQPDPLEETMDFAILHGMVPLARLQHRVRAYSGPGHAGIAAVRTVLDRRLRTTPHSVLERRALRAIRNAKLPDPVLQFEVRDRGRLIARGDLVYPADRILIELDGRSYHARLAAFERDRTRQNELAARGWIVLRFTLESLHRLPEVLALTLLSRAA